MCSVRELVFFVVFLNVRLKKLWIYKRYIGDLFIVMDFFYVFRIDIRGGLDFFSVVSFVC